MGVLVLNTSTWHDIGSYCTIRTSACGMQCITLNLVETVRVELTTGKVQTSLATISTCVPINTLSDSVWFRLLCYPYTTLPYVWWERMDSNHDQSLMMRMKVIIAAQSLIQIWRGYGESNPEHVIDSHVL